MSQNYKHFVTVNLIYFFGKKITNALEMPSFLKYRYSKSRQFSTKQVSAIATQKPSCFISLILGIQLQIQRCSTLLPKNVKLTRVSVANGNFIVVRSVLCQVSCNVLLYIIFYHSQFIPCYSITKALKSPTSTSSLREHVVYSSWFA